MPFLDNFVDGFSCFEAAAGSAPAHVQAARAEEAAHAHPEAGAPQGGKPPPFGPGAGQLPFFLLTVKWEELLVSCRAPLLRARG